MTNATAWTRTDEDEGGADKEDDVDWHDDGDKGQCRQR